MAFDYADSPMNRMQECNFEINSKIDTNPACSRTKEGIMYHVHTRWPHSLNYEVDGVNLGIPQL